MSQTMTIECNVHFRRQGTGARRQMEPGPKPRRRTNPAAFPASLG